MNVHAMRAIYRTAKKHQAGAILCARCGRVIEAGERWDLGHSDADRTIHTGPEHRKCNRGAPSRRKYPAPRQRAELPPIPRHSREW